MYIVLISLPNCAQLLFVLGDFEACKAFWVIQLQFVLYVFVAVGWTMQFPLGLLISSLRKNISSTAVFAIKNY